MSAERPEFLRKLLGDEAADDAAPPASGPRPEAAPLGRARIEVEPEVPDYVPQPPIARGAAPAPPSGMRRFGPSFWPWPVATRGRRALNIAIVTLAVAGAIGGLFITWYHLTTDPLADAHAYFDAAVRLNRGQPLYPTGADPNAADFYRYPPLLAVALRPIVGLGWPAFAAIWEAIVVGSFVLLLRRLGGGRRTWLALGILAMPVGWCLAIGQAQVPTTLLVAIGQPWSIALAANLKLFPALIALWWIGRRDVQATGAFVAWLVLLGLAQAIAEWNGTLAFLNTVGFSEIGEVLNISPYAVAPWVWVVFVVLGVVLTLQLARTRWGWLAAVALATLATPRLLTYMLMGLLAALREPEIASEEPEGQPFQPVRYGRR